MKILQRTQSVFLRSAALLTAMTVGATGLQAQTYNVTITTGSSSGTLFANFGLDLEASIIGNYNLGTNPGGTRTLPGLFGGSGNVAVPTDINVDGTFDHAGSPQGTWTMDLDLNTNTFDLTNFQVDVLGGNVVNGNQDTTLTFGGFRTFNPNSVFGSSSPIVLSGGVNQAENFLIAQSAPTVSSTLTPTGNPDEYSFNVQVPVNTTFDADYLGTVVPVGPFIQTFPFEGILKVQPGTGTIEISMDLTRTLLAVTPNPVPGFSMTNLPIAVDTVLPAGNVANLLLNGTIESAFCDFDIRALWFAKGFEPGGFSAYCANMNPNSTTQIGQLAVTGSANVFDQDLTFTATQLPANKFGILVMSKSTGFFNLGGGGQGILCLGGPFYRINQNPANIFLSNGAGVASTMLNFNTLPQGQVFMAGDTWHFQLWYRDQNPMNTSNTTTAVTVQFFN